MKLARPLLALLLVSAAFAACSAPPTAPAEPTIPVPDDGPGREDFPMPPKPRQDQP
jgi:hypothetical protein